MNGSFGPETVLGFLRLKDSIVRSSHLALQKGRFLQRFFAPCNFKGLSVAKTLANIMPYCH